MLKPNLSSENEEKIHSDLSKKWSKIPILSCNFNTMMAAKFKCCCLRARVVFDECLAEKRRVSPYNAIWWCRQQTLRKLMKNMTRKSWIFWNWQSLPELSDLEKSDLKIRSRSVKKRSTIRSRSWSRKMVKSDLRSDQKVICRSRSWSVDQDRHYFDPIHCW